LRSQIGIVRKIIVGEKVAANHVGHTLQQRHRGAGGLQIAITHWRAHVHNGRDQQFAICLSPNAYLSCRIKFRTQKAGNKPHVCHRHRHSRHKPEASGGGAKGKRIGDHTGNGNQRRIICTLARDAPTTNRIQRIVNGNELVEQLIDAAAVIGPQAMSAQETEPHVMELKPQFTSPLAVMEPQLTFPLVRAPHVIA
jgi:hypothetical protein